MDFAILGDEELGMGFDVVEDAASIRGFDVVSVLMLGMLIVVVFFFVGPSHRSDEEREGGDGGFYFHMVFGLVV